MIEDGIRELLLQDAGFQALAVNRLYRPVLPQTPVPVLPAATCQRITMQSESTLDGHADVTTIRLQVDAWGSDMPSTWRLASAMQAALEDVTGALPDGTYVFGVQIDTCTDRFEAETRR